MIFKKILLSVFILFAVIFVSLALAQEGTLIEGKSVENLAPAADGLLAKMSLELRDMDIIDTLKFIALKGNINIIANKEITGKVNLFLKNVTIKEALEMVLAANNLAYEKRGEIFYVMPASEYKLLHGQNFQDTKLVKVFNLKYAKPDSIFKALEVLKSDMGKVVIDEESGTVIVTDTAEKLVEIEKVVLNMDQPLVTKAFSLQYAKAEDVKNILISRLDNKKTGSISVDSKNNQIIISAFSERMKEAEALIKNLDKKTKQVLLEAKVIKVILKDGFDMGVDWDKVWLEASKHGLNFASNFSLPTTITDYFKVGVGNDTVTGHNYSGIVKILQEYGETRNLSSPSIAVIDGQEAKIHVGRTEAYVTTTLSTGSTTSATAAQVTFLDVGVQLVVTPTINDMGFVTMKIKPEISNVDENLSYQIAADVTNFVPLVARTSAETTVMVKDGRTIVIGGLRKDEKIKTVDKFPFLGDLPLIGAAFRRTSDDLEKTEVVVFITPRIIAGDVDAQDIKLQPKGLRGYDK